MENRETAIRNFHSCNRDSTQNFHVIITETLKMTVEVEAEDQQQAEQIISDDWRNSKYILDSDNFVDVEFKAIPVDEAD